MPILSGLYNQLFGNRQQGQQPTASPEQSQYGQVNDFERFLLDTKQAGQDITAGMNRAMGLNTDQQGNFDILGTWRDVVDFDEDDDGSVDFGRIATTPFRGLGAAAQTVGALPGMMVQGWSEAPTYLYSALTGSPIAADDAVDENGNIMRGDLDAAERIGAGVYGGLNVIPVGFGSAIGKGGAQIAKAAGRNVTKDQLEKGLFGAAADQAAASAKGIGGVMKSAGIRAGEQMLEEGTEEAVQEVGQNALNDRDLMTNVGESFIGGALAGGTMGALRGGFSGAKNYMVSKDSSDDGKSSAKAMTAPDHIESVDPTANWGSEMVYGVRQDLQRQLQQVEYEPGSSSAMGQNLRVDAGPDAVTIGIQSFEDIAESEEAGPSAGYNKMKLNEFFKDALNGKTVYQAYIDEARAGNLDAFIAMLNSIIDAKAAAHQYLDLMMFKNPGGTSGLVRTKLSKITADTRVGLSQSVAYLLNADFDSDHYVFTVDNSDSYSQVRYASEMISGPNSRSDYKDLPASFGIKESNAKKTAEILSGLYDSLGIKNSTVTKKDIQDIIELCMLSKVQKGFDINNVSGYSETAIDMFKNGGLNTWASVMGWMQENATVEEVTKAELINKAYIDVSKNNISALTSNAAAAASVAKEISDGDIETGRTSTLGTYGKTASALEFFMNTWRSRLFLDNSRGEAVCRENLSIYFTIKNSIRWYIEAHPGTDPMEMTSETLMEQVAKYSLGLRTDDVHPETLATGAIKGASRNDAMAEYQKLYSKTTITSWEDYNNMIPLLRNAYESNRKAYVEALRREDSDGKIIKSTDEWTLPVWSDENSESIFMLVFGDDDVRDLAGIETTAPMTLKGYAMSVGVNSETASHLFVNKDETDLSVFVKNLASSMVSVLRRKSEKAEKATLDSLASYIEADSGVFAAFRNSGYDKNSLKDNSADYRSIIDWIHGIELYCGRKDFIKAGFANIDVILDTAKNNDGPLGDIARALFSGDVAVVKEAIITLSFRNKLKSLYEDMYAFSKAVDPKSIEALRDKVGQDLYKVSKISPFYNAFANYVSNVIWDKGSASQEFIASQFDANTGFMATMMTMDDYNKRNSNLRFILQSCDDNSMLSDKCMFAAIVESETDSLDMQSMSSRVRTAKPFMESSATENRAYLSEKKKAIFDAVRRSGIDSGRLIGILGLRAKRRMNEINTTSIQSLFLKASLYEKAKKDKTDNTSEGQAIWDQSSISDVGFSPTEMQNFAPGVIDMSTLIENPQLASIMFLTDYIESNGGIVISFDGSRSRTINSRSELISLILDDASIKSDRDITIEHLEKLCDWCPNMVNILSPVSSSYTDTDTYRKTPVIKPEDDIRSLIDELSQPADISKGERGGASLAENEIIKIQDEIIKSRLLSTSQGISFMLSTFDFDAYNSSDRFNANAMVNDHISECVRTMYALSTADKDTRAKIIEDIVGASIGMDISDLSSMADSFDRNFKSANGFVDEDVFYGLTSRRLESAAMGNIVHSFLYGKDGSYDLTRIMNSLGFNVESESLPNVDIDLDTMAYDLIATELTKTPIPFLRRISVASSAYLSRKFDDIAWDTNCLDDLRAAFSNEINLIESAINALDAKLATLSANDVSRPKLETDMKTLQAAYSGMESIRDVAIDKVQKAIKNASIPGRIVGNNIDELVAGEESELRFIGAMEDAIKWVRTGSNEIASFEKELKEFKEKRSDMSDDKSIKWRANFECRVMAQLAQSSLLTYRVGTDTDLRFAGDGLRIMTELVDMISAEDILGEVEKVSTNPRQTGFKSNLKLHITSRFGIQQYDAIAMAVLTANVTEGVTINANTRKQLISLMLMNDSRDFSPLNETGIAATRKDHVGTAAKLAEMYNGANVDDKTLYSGWYRIISNGKPGEWKLLQPHTLVEWRRSGFDAQIEYDIALDDSCGFMTSKMVQSVDGRKYNEFTSALAKINIGSAEAENLKTKKKPTLYKRATFAVIDKVGRECVKKAANRINGIPTDPVQLSAFIGEAVLDTKKEYRKMLGRVLGVGEEFDGDAMSGRDSLDLTYSEVKCIADHLVQGATVTFADGSHQTVMYRDILNGTVQFDPSRTPVSVEVHILSFQELGMNLAKSTQSIYGRSLNDNEWDLSNKDGAWNKAFDEAVKRFTISVLDDKGFRANMRRTMSQTHTREAVGEDRYASNESTMLNYIKSEQRHRKLNLDVLSPAFKEYYQPFLEKYGVSIVKVFGDVRDDRDAQIINSMQEADENNGWIGEQMCCMVSSMASQAEIKAAIRYAKKTGVQIVVVGANREAAEKSIIMAGFLESNIGSVKTSGNASVFKYSSVLHSFMQDTPRAGYDSTQNPNAWDVTLFDPECEFGDGVSGATQAFIDLLKKRQAYYTDRSTIDLASIEPSKIKDSAGFLSGNQIKSAVITDEGLEYALSLIKDQSFDKSVIKRRILEAVKTFQSDKTGINSDGLADGKVTGSKLTCVGIYSVVIYGRQINIPIVVDGASNASNITCVMSGNKLHVASRIPLFGSTDDAGLVKWYDPDNALKGTENLSGNPDTLAADRSLACEDGTMYAVHHVMNDEFNSGKVDYDQQIPVLYSNFMQMKNLSMWFERVGDGKSVKIREEMFPGWDSEDIAKFIYSPSSRREFCEEIVAGKRKLIIPGNSIATAVLNRIVENSVSSRFDVVEALSGFVARDKELHGVGEELDFAKTFHTKQGQYNVYIVFNGISPMNIQELFHAISSKDFESTLGPADENTTCTFDRKGMMRVNGGGRYRVFIGKRNYDSTQSRLQESGGTSRIGNKQRQMNLFTNRIGDPSTLLAEMLDMTGNSGEFYRYTKKAMDEMSTDSRESMTSEQLIEFYDNAIRTVSPEESIRRAARRQTRPEMVRKYDRASLPIRKEGEDGGTPISLIHETDSKFADPDLQELKAYAQRVLFGGQNITCIDFMENVLKPAVSYTKPDNGADIYFYINDLRHAIDAINESLSSNGIPFSGTPTISSGKNSRFGMPIMSNKEIAFWRKYAGDRVCKSDEDLDTRMMKAFDSMMSSLELEDSAKKKSLFALGVHLADGTRLDGHEHFRTTVSGLSVNEVLDAIADIDESILPKYMQKMPELYRAMDEYRKNCEAIVNAQKNRYVSRMAHPADGAEKLFRGSNGEPQAVEMMNRLCSIRQIMAVCEPMLGPASIVERQVYGQPIKALMHKGIKDKSGKLTAIYDSKVSDYISSDERRANLVHQISEASKAANVRDTFGAIRSISFLGEFNYILELASESGNVKSFLKQYFADKNDSRFEKAANIAFDWASGKNIGSNVQIDIFLSDVLRRISLDERFASVYLEADQSGTCEFERRLAADPAAFITEMFRADSPLKSIAMKSFNTSMQGDAAQRSAMSVLINELCSQHPVAGVFFKTTLCPFVQYGINSSTRHLNAILPMSTFNYVLTTMLSNSDAKIIGLGGMRWSDLNLDDTQVVTSLQEALRLDMLHMGATATAALIIGLGCLEPPDDDDKWCNVNEWTFLGQRIELNWWLKDTIGPVLGIACAWKSAELGKPNISVMLKDMASCMAANPLVRSTDLVEAIIDPYGSYMESYYEDVDRFSKATDGKPSPSEVLFANASIFGLNWATSFCTPAVIKDIYRNSTEYEVSYKKIYEENEYGQVTEAGRNGQTQYTTYFDQKLRQATKKNPTLGWLCDMVLNPNTGYLANEMPRTVYYDPAQMDAYQALSLYTTDEFGNKVQKSDQECQAIALGIIMTLQSYDDMEELAKTGFCIPYDTLDYVSDVVWDVANSGTELYEGYIKDGALDYYALGGGDYELGQQMAGAIASLYEQNFNYWNDFYYNKLWSDEMKSGLAKYNRYNTTYQQDANGEWYATGYRNDIGNIVSPFLVAPGEHSSMLGIDRPGSTMGYGEDWDTQSVVTGASTGERALIPYVENIKTPKFNSRGSNGDGTGYSKRYAGYSSSYGGSSYASPVRPSTTRVGNSGGGYSSFSLPRTPGIDTTTYRSPNLSYLRPSFETKGSSKAYKREEL